MYNNRTVHVLKRIDSTPEEHASIGFQLSSPKIVTKDIFASNTPNTSVMIATNKNKSKHTYASFPKYIKREFCSLCLSESVNIGIEIQSYLFHAEIVRTLHNHHNNASHHYEEKKQDPHFMRASVPIAYVTPLKPLIDRVL